jgi:hypothetical protein
VFENRILRKTFGPKGEEVTRGVRKVLNEELHKFFTKYYSGDQTNWHVGRMREMKNAYKILVTEMDIRNRV